MGVLPEKDSSAAKIVVLDWYSTDDRCQIFTGLKSRGMIRGQRCRYHPPGRRCGGVSER